MTFRLPNPDWSIVGLAALSLIILVSVTSEDACHDAQDGEPAHDRVGAFGAPCGRLGAADGGGL